MSMCTYTTSTLRVRENRVGCPSLRCAICTVPIAAGYCKAKGRSRLFYATCSPHKDTYIDIPHTRDVHNNNNTTTCTCTCACTCACACTCTRDPARPWALIRVNQHCCACFACRAPRHTAPSQKAGSRRPWPWRRRGATCRTPARCSHTRTPPRPAAGSRRADAARGARAGRPPVVHQSPDWSALRRLPAPRVHARATSAVNTAAAQRNAAEIGWALLEC